MIRLYLATGLIVALVFGGLCVWFENRQHENRSNACALIALLGLPALIGAGLLDVAGAIGHH